MTTITPPNLTNRLARCSLGCGAMQPSSEGLLAFEYRGSGSKAARDHCAQCGYYEAAHGEGRGRDVCLRFRAHGAYEFDGYYCGCEGNE